jgi:hypothetical protein
MTKRDLFRFLLKLFGLYSLITSTFSLFSVIPLLDLDEISAYAGGLFLILAMVGIFLILVFKPDLIVNALKLDSGFDNDTIVFNDVDGKTILKIGIVLIAGFFFIKNLSHGLTAVYFFIRNKIASRPIDDFMRDLYPSSGTEITLIFLNLLLSWLLITNVHRIANYLFDTGAKQRGSDV